MKQYHSEKWFRVLCGLFVLSVVCGVGGDVPAASKPSTESTFCGTVIKPPHRYAYASSVLNDNGMYKMWFCADFKSYPGKDQIAYAESSDGKNWGKAIRVLGPTAGTMDSVHTCDPSVLIKTEIAPRGGTSAGSSLSGWEPAKAIDGAASSCWSSAGRLSANSEEWLELRFGSTIGVNAIKLTPRSPGGYGFPVDFKLQYYDGSWCDIAGQSYTNYANPGTTPQEFKFPTVRASRVRLYVTKLGVDNYNNHYCQIAEISATRTVYYMWYTGTEHGSGAFNQIFLAMGCDGKKWTKYGAPTPVIPLARYGFKALADFEKGVDGRLTFKVVNYGYAPPVARYAWTNPPDGSDKTDDINYWDVQDNGDSGDGFVDACLNLSGSERNWSGYSNMIVRMYVWTTRRKNGGVRIWAHDADTGRDHCLGTHKLGENAISALDIDISKIPNRSNIDRMVFRVRESYFSDLRTATNKQRTHLFGITLSKSPNRYGIGQSSVIYKDGYFWHFYTDRSGLAKDGLYLQRSQDGIKWIPQNDGKRVFEKTCADVKYLPTLDRYYMVYGEVDDDKIYWNVSSGKTSWPGHSLSRIIDAGKISTMNSNACLLGDGRGYMDANSKVYYGAARFGRYGISI